MLVLALRERDRPAAGAWEVSGLTITDPTGNRWDNDAVASEAVAPDLLRVTANLDLPEEPAYRVRLELVRRDRFPADELWTIRDLPFPQPGAKIELRRTHRLQGCRIELSRLFGADAETKLGFQSSEPTAVLRVFGSATQLLVREPAAFYPDGFRDAHTVGGVYFVSFSAEGPGRASLTLALTPRRIVEFLAHAERQ
jgi:hypothetical protein